MDNGSNNGTMLRHLSIKLDTDLSPVEWAQKYYIRCMCHVIHLGAGDIATSANVDFEDITTEDMDLDMSEGLAELAGTDALKHLFKFVKLVRKSTQSHDIFKKLTGGLTIPQANTTRWSSWFHTIDRALKLQPIIEHYQYEYNHPVEGVVTAGDWRYLRSVSLLPDISKVYI